MITFGIAKARLRSRRPTFTVSARPFMEALWRKSLQVLSGIEFRYPVLPLKCCHDYRGLAGRTFDLQIVVGLPQRPESGDSDGYIAFGRDVGATVKAVGFLLADGFRGAVDESSFWLQRRA